MDKPPILSGTLSRPDVVHSATSTTCRLRQSAGVRNLDVLPFVAYDRDICLSSAGDFRSRMHEETFPIGMTGRN